MKTWKKCELHTHTYESDGHHSIDELLGKAKELYNIDAMALTDHNTMSGNEKFIEAAEAYHICGIPGFELTTFYGHILYLGVNKFVEWRNLSKANLEEKMDQLDKGEGLLGIAHPRRLADPISTGSMFSYEIQDYSLFDYTEVWTRSNPTSHKESQLNMNFWIDKLCKGFRMTGVSGRDWHIGGEEKHSAYTLIKMEETTLPNVLQGIKKGRVQCTYGPVLTLYREDEGKLTEAEFGDTIDNSGRKRFKVTMDWLSEASDNMDTVANIRLTYHTNLGECVLDSDKEREWQFTVDEDIQFMLLKVYGCFKEETDQMIGFTNPVYF